MRKIVRELNDSDNLFYEIQNEPWADRAVTVDRINPYLKEPELSKFPNAVDLADAASLRWQAAVAGWIKSEEERLPKKHLIAQNYSNFGHPVRAGDLAPGVSIVHFHYAYPTAVTWNYGLGKLLGYDETGFLGTSTDHTYRREAWNFLLAGGGLFNNLDYTFTVSHEGGDDDGSQGPGYASRAYRQQLRILSQFIHSLELVSLSPDHTLVKRAPGVFTRALGAPGRQYAIYITGRSPGEITLDLPGGKYRAEWINPVTGRTDKQDEFDHRGGDKLMTSPTFEQDIALRLTARK